MEEWPPEGFLDDEEEDDRQSVPHTDTLPAVIQVFYRNIPSTLANPDDITSEGDFKLAHRTSHVREKPQRVLLNSAL